MSGDPVYAEILDDVRRRTGRTFATMRELWYSDSEVLDDIVPVIADWVDRVPPNYRPELYQLIGRCRMPRLRVYFEDFARWWRFETDAIGLDLVVRILASMVRDSDAQRFWELGKNDGPGVSRSTIWARLAKFPEVRNEVLESIVNALHSGHFDFSELHDYVTLADPRIVEWFKGHIDSKDRRPRGRTLRELARKSAGKIPPPPEWLRLVEAPPDQTNEVYSREADLSKLDSALSSIGKKLGVAAPKLGRVRGFLSHVDHSQWFTGIFGSDRERMYQLWLRAEDVDVAEIVITEGQPAARAESVM